MAVIGSGPAGFYTAYKVMSKIGGSMVDMYEQLPVPFGLVRFGVAPDHPEVKNCQAKFEEVAESSRFNFIGNISIGNQQGGLPLRALMAHYDAILFAYGASRDRALGIRGEEYLKGIYSARAFVGWYNGLPEFSDLAPDLTVGEEAVIIGQGNVALDVARILLQDPDVLGRTDITSNAMEALKKSKVNRVRVVGRRGPMQGAFTIKEVRELMKFPSVAFHPVDESLIPEDISKLPRPTKRIMEVLRKGSVASVSMAARSWSFDFCLSPISFKPSLTSPTRLGSMSLERTHLKPDPFALDAKAVRTDEIVDIPASMAFRSIGYKSEALSEFKDLGIPFNDRLGIIPNDHLGRVVNSSADWMDEKKVKYLPGLYCAGWVKRGPTGVIASTMSDAFATAESIAEDWFSHTPFIGGDQGHHTGWEGVKYEAEKRGCRRVSWEDWKKIDAVEKAAGQRTGKVREKFTKVHDMLRVLD
ncbi:NADPH-adrenodoxin reductase Arh1, partial [Diplocarpon rosae]